MKRRKLVPEFQDAKASARTLVAEFDSWCERPEKATTLVIDRWVGQACAILQILGEE